MSCLLPVQVTAEINSATIVIIRIYEHTPNGLSTGKIEFPISPSAGDPKEVHTISTSVLAATSGVDLKSLNTKANNQELFVHVDWRYQTIYPKFTTRHRVVPEPSLSILFAGGTSWAEDIARTPAFHTPHEHMPVPDYLRRPAWSLSPQPPKPSFNMGNRVQRMTPQLGSWTPSPHFPDTPRSMSPSSGDDQLSICSDPTSVGSTISEVRTPRLFSPPPSRQNSSSTASITGDWMDRQIQQQFQDEEFLKQKQDAEELFERTGDLSGLIAVMEAANRFSAFPPL
ncbi:hypothetical protein QBC40DRAFT_63437 [Triangularia verruculosa]|uniref:Uncharacterized protein n=1 Tax=Triangularia verruculosa TaxID=2587418 RepID=A0AAN7AVQ2_9PEZI|nr:hypothetical protein QBC40DRAFT_63437 [Triangularia verruculosa]